MIFFFLILCNVLSFIFFLIHFIWKNFLQIDDVLDEGERDAFYLFKQSSNKMKRKAIPVDEC